MRRGDLLGLEVASRAVETPEVGGGDEEGAKMRMDRYKRNACIYMILKVLR